MNKIIISITFLFLALCSTVALAQDLKESFVCTPCDRDCDILIFNKSGLCPHCNMALINQKSKEMNITQAAILLFDGVQIIDFTGPFEVLGQAGYDVVTVAASPAIKTNMGLKVLPDYTFANCPNAGIFIIPGGNTSEVRKSPEGINWIKQYAAKSQMVMSVCNGALILADTHFLNGLTATTYYNAISELKTEFPKIKVISDQRFVDNGKFITTAGLSSGIDGALHIVEKLQGKYKAQTVALSLEYDWKPNDNYSRASLADKHLNKIFEGNDERHPSISTVKLLNTEGGKNTWKVEFQVTSTSTSEEIKKVIESIIAKKVNWNKEKDNLTNNSSWRFTTEENENWKGFLVVKPISSNTNNFLVTLSIDKQ